jgi:hypothetical protein
MDIIVQENNYFHLASHEQKKSWKSARSKFLRFDEKGKGGFSASRNSLKIFMCK